MGNYKTVFKRIGGRVIPLRIAMNNAPDEYQKIVHVQKIRAILKNAPTQIDPIDRWMHGKFLKSYTKGSIESGMKIARRIAKLKKG